MNPITTIIFRIIMTGDIFMMAYVDNNIELLKGNFLTLTLPYKLVDILDLEHVKSIGFQLITNIYNIEANYGPNARHNVFGYVSFGYIGSMFFSFFIGMTTSFIRNKLIKSIKINLESMIIFIFIVSNVFSIETDFQYAIFIYISEVIVFLGIYIASYILTSQRRFN